MTLVHAPVLTPMSPPSGIPGGAVLSTTAISAVTATSGVFADVAGGGTGAARAAVANTPGESGEPPLVRRRLFALRPGHVLQGPSNSPSLLLERSTTSLSCRRSIALDGRWVGVWSLLASTTTDDVPPLDVGVARWGGGDIPRVGSGSPVDMTGLPHTDVVIVVVVVVATADVTGMAT